MNTSQGDTRIVVLGGGFGGVNAVLRLERAFRHDSSKEITLVSNENFFLYTPLLHEVATGGVETRHIAYPLRRVRGKKNFCIRQGTVTGIDLDRKTVALGGDAIPYDYLLIALGSTTNIAQLPNPAHNIYTLKNLHDGMVLRNHIIRMFELADIETDHKRQKQLLTFFVVGAGYTGAQIVAEMRNFAANSLVKGYRKVAPEMVRVVLVEEKDRVLSGDDVRLAETTLKLLRRQGVEVRLSSRVTRAWDHGIELDHCEMESTETVVWTAGIVASPVVAALPVEKDERGRVVVDQYLRIPGYAGVYALGDNAHFCDAATGAVLPPRAHYAVRQPKTAVANMIAEMRGGPLRPYKYSKSAELVSLGPRNAAMNLYGVHLSGLPARVIWLAGYLSIMASTYNRTRVAIDWALNLFFDRDNTLLSIDR